MTFFLYLSFIFHFFFKNGFFLEISLIFTVKDPSTTLRMTRLLRELHLDKFCGAVMWVLGEVFALPREEMLVTPDERRGRELLEEIMIAGNFGHYDPRIKDLAHEGHFRRVTRKAIRSMHLARLYPHESLWTTYFTAYHALWRGLKLWRWE